MKTNLLLSYLNNIQKGNQQFISFQNSIRKNSNLRPINILESQDEGGYGDSRYSVVGPSYWSLTQGDPQPGSRQSQPPPGDLTNWTWVTNNSSSTGGYWQYNGNVNDNHWQWNSESGIWIITINGVTYFSFGGDSPIEQVGGGGQQSPQPMDEWSEYFSQQGLPEWPWWDFLSKLEDAVALWIVGNVPGIIPGAGGQAIAGIASLIVGFFGADIAAFIIANNLGPALVGPGATTTLGQILTVFQPGPSNVGFAAWNNVRQIATAIANGQSISSLFSGGAVNGVTMGALVRSLAIAGLAVGSILSIVASWWHIYNILQDPNWDSSTPPPISHKDIWNFVRQPVPQVDSPESLAPTPSVIPGGIPGVPPPSTSQQSGRLDLGGWFPGY
jgi:hypothetical protein